MSGVGMNDVDTVAVYRRAELQHGRRIKLESRRAALDDEPRMPRPLRERLFRPGGNDRAVPASCERRREPQRLALPAAPASLRVHVEHG